ncbi:hypothetical protein D0U04_03490 [Bacillus clarus]|uniref:Uncharacterized protein n=2 Tax=Bacillus clarus TaxID=2338372 RepID=A0ABX9L139_9BACI|nr:hypothetical protein D0U04_03490 [Bacillus clarus]
MSHFNEYKELPVCEAMITAIRNMGTVIVAAGVILSVTFVALYPPGVLTILAVSAVIFCVLLLSAFK